MEQQEMLRIRVILNSKGEDDNTYFSRFVSFSLFLSLSKIY